MSRLLGSTLPTEVLARLRGNVVGPWRAQVILLTTLDAEGRPHIAMISYFELAALDAHHLRLAIGRGSHTEENLQMRRKATLALVDPSGPYYLKATATAEAGLVGFPSLAVFHLTLEEILLDEIRGDVGESAQLTSGITFTNSEDSLSHRQKLRRALLTHSPSIP